MKRTQLWASGGGTQSAAIAALIVTGKVEKPDLAVIVDTEREQSTTWEYTRTVIEPALASVGVVLHRVRKSQFERKDLYGGKDNRTLLLPAFSTQGGEVGKLSNWCSSYWKREVIKRWANSHGVDAVDTWLGISTDELGRVQKCRSGKWRTRYPLIEQAMNRGDCVALVRRMGWPDPPRSSCYMCPNHTAHEWRDIRDNKPADWQAAIQFERELRLRDPHAFLHHDCVPLDQADLDDRNGVLFGHNCTSGHCFV
ncbi:hypothetical protein SAMN03159335_06193 [Burkholderia cepacia]|uniref:hypothetical protein n=1 Tax=Burkholderia cepacia complex TaxID=87882 RepID=UPI0008AAD855|nr:hypothetical protein [Burkholderia cepacia]SEU40107.1 hypothetical protein SAMN03159335_06193 [Burkholderia cepacia]HDR9068188.1 hypothetical protein [Burkholderia vietnamiensis]